MSCSKIDVSNFSETCRLCLSQGTDMTSLFEELVNCDTEMASLSSKINNTVGVELSPADGLPGQICQECYERVDTWHTFRLMCHNTDLALRHYIKVLEESEASQNLQQPDGVKNTSEGVAYSLVVAEEECSLKLIGPDGTALELTALQLAGDISIDVDPTEDASLSTNPAEEVNKVVAVGRGGLDTRTVSEREILKYLSCSFCGKTFTRRNNMKLHQKRYHHKEISASSKCSDMFECQFCSRQFHRIDYLKTHELRVHTRERPFKCHCGRGFVRKQDRDWHQVKVHFKTNSTLHDTESSLDNVCNVSQEDACQTKNSCNVTETSNLIDIRIVSTGDDCQSVTHEYTCKVCDFKCPELNLCEEHIMQSHVIDGSQTSKTYKKSFDFLDHTNSVTDRGPYFCSFCGKEFLKLNCVRAHEKRHRAGRHFMCNMCGKTFRSLYQLKVHEQTHTEEKPFNCEDCDQRFRTKTNLRAHKKRHSIDPNFVCKTCGQKFLAASGLKRHELLHSGLKPHSCEECGKCFVTLAECTRHMKYHSGIRKHVCEHCGKGFFESGHLKIHLRLHTRERPYNCTHCVSSFVSMSKLKRHQKTHIREDEDMPFFDNDDFLDS